MEATESQIWDWNGLFSFARHVSDPGRNGVESAHTGTVEHDDGGNQ